MKTLTNKYRGEWVSISKNYKKVYVHSPKADVLVKKIKKSKIKDGIIMRIPSQITTAYVG